MFKCIICTLKVRNQKKDVEKSDRDIYTWGSGLGERDMLRNSPEVFFLNKILKKLENKITFYYFFKKKEKHTGYG